ncbi:MAG: type II toxin-antitoxin system RelE/ParE family toxin [bacterium]|nr:type II toxin-antitoxin system RelE/ParE family toxin [bacterium]
MTAVPWDLVVAQSARRSVDRLPEKIAVAVLGFMLDPLLENPHRVGEPLRGDIVGLYSARVGAYRVVYEIDPASHTIQVIYIDHRADIYRPR